MNSPVKALFAAVLAAFGSVLPAHSQANFPQVMPADTVYGAQFVSGPGVAISFTTLAARLFSGTGPFAFGPGTTSPLTDGSVTNTSSGTKTAQSIYSPFSASSGTEYDVIRGVLDLESNASGTVSQANAIGGYAFCNVTVGAYPNAGNCVALSGFTVVNRTGGSGWGIATATHDNSTSATYSSGGSRTVIGAEHDIGIWDTTGTANAVGALISLQGIGTSAGNLTGISITKAAAASLTWSFGVNCANGSIGIGCLNVGAQSTSGTSIASQAVVFEYFNGAATQKAMTMKAAGVGGFVFATTDTSVTNAMDWSGVTVNTCMLKIATGCTISGAGALSVAAADGARWILGAGVTKGIRFYSNSTGSIIEGVDNTGVASYQPITFGGLSLNFSGSGVAIGDYNTTTASTWTFAAAVTINNATVKITTLPGSAGGGGLFVCIDSSGVMYKKATCP